MLSRAQRLNRTQFTEFFKAGKRIHGEYVTIVFTPFPTFHGAVVISKKVARGAVERNTMRRQIYQQLRSVGLSFPGVYIVLLKPGFSSLTRKNRQLTIRTVLQKVEASKK